MRDPAPAHRHQVPHGERRAAHVVGNERDVARIVGRPVGVDHGDRQVTADRTGAVSVLSPTTIRPSTRRDSSVRM